jgi:YidC/Oxa1 family membrane protein insertase
MEKNAIVAIVLSLLVLIVWQQVFIAPRQEQLEEERVQEAPVGDQPTPERPAEQPEQQADVPPVAVESVLSATEITRQQLQEDAAVLRVETPLLSVMLTTQGARAIEWKIKAHENVHGEAVDLVSDDSRRRNQYPLEVFTGDKQLDNELNQGIYQTSVNSVTLAEGDAPATMSLTYTTSTGLRCTKTLTFAADSYKVDMAVKFSDPAQVGNAVSVVWGPGIGADIEATPGRFQAGVVSSKTDAEKLVRDKAKKVDGLITYNNVQWSAIDRKYFVTALFPQSVNNTLSLQKLELQPLGDEEAKDIEPLRQLLIGVSQPLTGGECQLSIYGGPKERQALVKAYPGFEDLVDYGFFWFIAEPMARFMTFLYDRLEAMPLPGFLQSYGLVIICITILIKILFFPLTQKSFTSMKRMQTLQPKIKALQEKYKDKQQQQQEMMKLYKEEGVNPMGGCFPMLLQIPVFFALYQTLSQSIELRGASFLWITDLSASETLFFKPLVLMMGASMFLQQSLTPTTVADNKQAQMFKFMPLIFTAMFWNFPSGLVLYWFMNNLLTIGQQYLINKGGESAKPKERESQEKTTTQSSRKRRKKGK